MAEIFEFDKIKAIKEFKKKKAEEELKKMSFIKFMNDLAYLFEKHKITYDETLTTEYITKLARINNINLD